MSDPKLATSVQFEAARKQLDLGFDDVREQSAQYQLPVDKNAIQAIEKNEEPGRPTKASGGRNTDYEGYGKFYGTLSYKERLHLFYQLKGVVFLDDAKSVVKVDPFNLWGHLQKLEKDFKQKHKDPNVNRMLASPKAVDPARHLLDEVAERKPKTISITQKRSSKPC